MSMQFGNGTADEFAANFASDTSSLKNLPVLNSDSASILGGTNNAAISNNANGTANQGNSTTNFWYQPDVGGNAANRVNRPYDINYAYTEQVLKNNNGNLRMSLSIPNVASPTGSLVFRAHIDPNHLINDQKKRLVQLQTLTGVIMQDFGYEAEKLELRGTTGSAYYKEIAQLDAIFNNQSTQTNPAPVTLTIESRTYTCVWLGFTNQRQQTNQGGNLIEYTMEFVVLYRGIDQTSSSSLYTSPPPSSTGSLTSSGFTQNVSTGGLSAYQYCSGQSAIPKANIQDACNFISANWDLSLNLGPYPGDKIALFPDDLITVPLNWSSVF